MNLDQEIQRAHLVIQSANHVHAARLSDWTAALFTGGPNTRKAAMEAVLAATEALLDAQAFHADLIHRQNGTEPREAA